MMSALRRFWRWLKREPTPPRPPIAPARCCPDCRAGAGESLREKLAHVVQSHLDVEERWLLRMLMNGYHLNDLCALLGAGPDAVRYRVAALRAKIMVLLNRQQVDDCVRRTFHRMISGPWF